MSGARDDLRRRKVRLPGLQTNGHHRCQRAALAGLDDGGAAGP